MSIRRAVILRLVLSAALAAMVCWQVVYARQQTVVEQEAYTFIPQEIQQLDKYPRAHYAYGRKAWFEHRLEEAKKHLIRAVSGNMVDISAWLKLAQTELSLGNREKAVQILHFTHGLTRNIIRWKWDHVLLARELGREDIFLQSINNAISCNALQRDALQLLDMFYEQNVTQILPVMAAESRPLYLQWLMRWNRMEDSWLVWSSLSGTEQEDSRLYEPYVDFLIGNGAIDKAKLIWEKYKGINGITNPGFEQELSNKGFDWRYRTDEHQCWSLERCRTDPAEGRYALNLSFNGSENIRFNHVWQVVPVQPENEYLLSYWRKSRNLTTDERLFINIYSIGDGERGHWTGPMLPVDGNWQKESIPFSPPDQCQAVVVQITRNPSHRFGCKISGKAWFDDFRINRLTDRQALDEEQE